VYEIIALNKNNFSKVNHLQVFLSYNSNKKYEGEYLVKEIRNISKFSQKYKPIQVTITLGLWSQSLNLKLFDV